MGGEKIMILKYRTWKGNKKDKVKNKNKMVFVVFTLCSFKHTTIKKNLHEQVQ